MDDVTCLNDAVEGGMMHRRRIDRRLFHRSRGRSMEFSRGRRGLLRSCFAERL